MQGKVTIESIIQSFDHDVDRNNRTGFERVLKMELHLFSVPPWQQKIFSSTMAATGKQLKQSVKVFHSFMLYRLLPE